MLTQALSLLLSEFQIVSDTSDLVTQVCTLVCCDVKQNYIWASLFDRPFSIGEFICNGL